MSARAGVVCFGIAVADRVYEVDQLPGGEGKFTATGYRETGGGIAATAAVAIAALGGRATFAGALGDDPAGRFVLAEMSRLGVDCTATSIQPARRTPSACVIVDGAGERCAVVDRGTVWPPLPDRPVLDGARAVLADHRFPQESAALLAGLPDDVAGVLDAEGGTRSALQSMVSAASYPVFSRPGLLALTGIDDPERALLSVVAERAVAVGVTLGAAGSLWRLGPSLHAIAAHRVAVRDTTGCGDVFHGALALALSEGAAILEAAEFASAAAAVKAAQGQGWNGLASRARVTGLLRG